MRSSFWLEGRCSVIDCVVGSEDWLVEFDVGLLDWFIGTAFGWLLPAAAAAAARILATFSFFSFSLTESMMTAVRSCVSVCVNVYQSVSVCIRGC